MNDRMVRTICWFSDLMEQEAHELARGLRRRDPEVLERLIEQFQYRLIRYLRVLAGNPATAEDLFQETWIRVLEKGHRYSAKWKFEAWLFTIARNLAIDFLRQRKPLSLDALLAPDGTGTPRLPEPGVPNPYEELSKSEEGARLSSAMDRLPIAYQEVLMLRFHEELELSEIAAIVGSPVPTVKSRLYRGLETLRKVMEADQHGQE